MVKEVCLYLKSKIFLDSNKIMICNVNIFGIKWVGKWGYYKLLITLTLNFYYYLRILRLRDYGSSTFRFTYIYYNI